MLHKTDTLEVTTKADKNFLMAVLNQDYNKCAKWLKSGANINVRFGKYATGEYDVSNCGPNDTALMYAVKSEDCQLVRFLLENKAGTEVTYHREGKTPLMEAAFNHQVAIVELLLKYGANPNTTNKIGLTAMHYAFLSLREWCLNQQKIPCQQVVQLLLAANYSGKLEEAIKVLKQRGYEKPILDLATQIWLTKKPFSEIEQETPISTTKQQSSAELIKKLLTKPEESIWDKYDEYCRLATKHGERKEASDSLIKNPWDKDVAKIIIEITNQEEKLIGISGTTGFYFVTNIIVDGKRIPLESISYDHPLKLSDKNNYRLLFKYPHLSDKENCELPSAMAQHLLTFLTGGRRQGECCIDFINDLYFGCGSVAVNQLYVRDFFGAPIKNDKQIAIGQAVGIGKDLGSPPNHYAIYLGHGLFIAVMGNDCPIYVTTLEQMKLLYDDRFASVISPLTKASGYAPSVSLKI